jgi:hypothetical protein
VLASAFVARSSTSVTRLPRRDRRCSRFHIAAWLWRPVEIATTMWQVEADRRRHRSEVKLAGYAPGVHTSKVDSRICDCRSLAHEAALLPPTWAFSLSLTQNVELCVAVDLGQLNWSFRLLYEG